MKAVEQGVLHEEDSDVVRSQYERAMRSKEVAGRCETNQMVDSLFQDSKQAIKTFTDAIF